MFSKPRLSGLVGVVNCTATSAVWLRGRSCSASSVCTAVFTTTAGHFNMAKQDTKGNNRPVVSVTERSQSKPREPNREARSFRVPGEMHLPRPPPRARGYPQNSQTHRGICARGLSFTSFSQSLLLQQRRKRFNPLDYLSAYLYRFALYIADSVYQQVRYVNSA